MGIRFVRSFGATNVSPAALNMRCSGVVHKDGVVELSRTGGIGVIPASSSSTNTMVFGVAQLYRQGASDVETEVIPFTSDQLWEVDCVAVATTAQIGIRHALDDDLVVRNTATAVETGKGVFMALAMTGATTGSGKLLGYFEPLKAVQPDNTTTFS